MSEDSAHEVPVVAVTGSAIPSDALGGLQGRKADGVHDIVATSNPLEKQETANPMSPRTMPNIFSKRHTGLELDDYFVGPRDMNKHSKWPLFLQMQGSILPKMIVPMLIVGAWASLITVIFKHAHKPGVNPILLTITGFVVGLGLSFRSATAYERYAEGRRLWGQLILTCHTLGRVIWIHAVERPGTSRDDILGKLTAMNLLVAFAVSLKHRLRFEPYTSHEDLDQLIAHLDTFAQAATQDTSVTQTKPPNLFHVVGEHLGLSFATSNPRKLLKKATEPLGNLPLEITCYLGAYIDELVAQGQLPVPMQQTTAYNGLSALNDVLVNTERVLNTPLPIAYAIAIAQITWLYVALLPFQLYTALGWITIPATVAGAYIILGLLFIGREVENPFGNDTNDLPLDLFCLQIVQDLETISAKPKPKMSDFVRSERNKVLYPMSNSSYTRWVDRPESTIRNALRNRPYLAFAKPKHGNC